MSRIGKKPIEIPKGVTVKFEGNTVLVQGPKGKLDTPLPTGIHMEQKDGSCSRFARTTHRPLFMDSRALCQQCCRGRHQGLDARS